MSVNSDRRRTLLLVTGSGRSGTSTVTGALSRLGLHVPGPFLEANASNPKGFYESQWSLRFHNRLLRRAVVTIADGRPDAQQRLLAAVREGDRDELRDKLRELTSGHPVTVLKDPRTTWTLGLWREAAASSGVQLSSLVMLRHPAEVLGSRATYYAAGLESMGAETYAVRNLAGWINTMLTAERGSRGLRRYFVSYDGLLSDWRTALSAPLSGLGLPAPSVEPHAVDGFVDPDLSRHRLGWADVPMRDDLRELAEQTWSALMSLAADPGATSPEPALDEVRRRYDALYDGSRQLVQDALAAEATMGRRAGARIARRQARSRHEQSAGGRVRAVLGRLSPRP